MAMGAIDLTRNEDMNYKPGLMDLLFVSESEDGFSFLDRCGQ